MTYIMNFEKTYGEISIDCDNILLFYDIPIFFYKIINGQINLFYLYDQNLTKNRHQTEWLVSSVNKMTIEQLIMDKISIYDALVTNATSINFVKNNNVYPLDSSAYNKLKYLPKKNIMLNNNRLKEKFINNINIDK